MHTSTLHRHTSDSPHRRRLLLLVATMALLLYTGAMTGCARRAPVEEAPAHITRDIPDGANRLVLERLADEAAETDDVPKALYVDARQHLEQEGFAFAKTDDEDLILVTEPKQINEDLALRIDLNVQLLPGGGQLIAASEWAATTSATEWRRARWTTAQDSKDKVAFGAMIDALHGIEFDDLGTAAE